MVCGVYGVFDAFTGECLYVGQSKNVECRLQHHMAALARHAHIRTEFDQWFREHGDDPHSLESRLLERCEDTDDAKNFAECKWFSILRPRFYGVKPSMDYRWGMSDETRSKIREGQLDHDHGDDDLDALRASVDAIIREMVSTASTVDDEASTLGVRPRSLSYVIREVVPASAHVHGNSVPFVSECSCGKPITSWRDAVTGRVRNQSCGSPSCVSKARRRGRTIIPAGDAEKILWRLRTGESMSSIAGDYSTTCHVVKTFLDRLGLSNPSERTAVHSNVESGRMSAHLRWHVRRGVVSPDCEHCQHGTGIDRVETNADRMVECCAPGCRREAKAAKPSRLSFCVECKPLADHVNALYSSHVVQHASKRRVSASCPCCIAFGPNRCGQPVLRWCIARSIAFQDFLDGSSADAHADGVAGHA